MKIVFTKTYLRDLYTKGEADKKHRFQPHIIRRYIRVIDLMAELPDVATMGKYHSLNYEKLHGSKAGLSSVRVNDQYRIEFEEELRAGETIATICNITELSNHYE